MPASARKPEPRWATYQDVLKTLRRTKSPRFCTASCSCSRGRRFNTLKRDPSLAASFVFDSAAEAAARVRLAGGGSWTNRSCTSPTTWGA